MKALTKSELLLYAATILLFLIYKAGDVLIEYHTPLRITFWVIIIVSTVVFIIKCFGPVNFISTQTSASGLTYVSQSKQKVFVKWPEISTISFARGEALFQDLNGPYLDAIWIIKTKSGTRIEIQDEWSNRYILLLAFKKYLPNFDMASAKTALKSKEQGNWPCFSTI